MEAAIKNIGKTKKHWEEIGRYLLSQWAGFRVFFSCFLVPFCSLLQMIRDPRDSVVLPIRCVRFSERFHSSELSGFTGPDRLSCS